MNTPTSESEILTAERFAELRPDLPECGRWIELVSGRLVTLDPPDDLHGNVVLHLSKALAEHLHDDETSAAGYLCFDLGLLVSRHPDTIYFPALCYLDESIRFAHSDQVYTTSPPELVIEIASTNARRRGLNGRLSAYQQWGVETVWIVDPVEKQLHVSEAAGVSESYGEDEWLMGSSVWGGLRFRVGDLFAAPDWWK